MNYITLLTTPESFPIGKVYDQDGGKVSPVGNIKRATAKTIKCDSVSEVLDVYKKSSLSTNSAIILGYFNEVPPEQEVNIVTERQFNAICESRGVKHPMRRTTSIKAQNGKLYVARIKRLMSQSDYFLMDMDVVNDMPAAIKRAVSPSKLANLWEGFADVEHAIIGSSSSRIEGSKNNSKHVIFRAEYASDIANFGKRLFSHALINKPMLSFKRTLSNGVVRKGTIFDTSVFSEERIIYATLPTVLDTKESPANVQIHALDSQIVQGKYSTVDTLELALPKNDNSYEITSSSFNHVDRGTISPDFELETSRISGQKEWYQISEILDYMSKNDLIKLRCESSAFRPDSHTENAYIRYSKGHVMVRDNGSGTHYYYSEDDVKELKTKKLKKQITKKIPPSPSSLKKQITKKIPPSPSSLKKQITKKIPPSPVPDDCEHDIPLFLTTKGEYPLPEDLEVNQLAKHIYDKFEFKGHIFRTSPRNIIHYTGTGWLTMDSSFINGIMLTIMSKTSLPISKMEAVSRIIRNGSITCPMLGAEKKSRKSLPPHLRAVKRGLYNENTGKVEPHTTDYFYPCQKYAKYDIHPSHGTSELFHETLKSLVEQDGKYAASRLKNLRMYMGYLFSGMPNTEGVVIHFFGDGGNGKSILGELARRTHGKQGNAFSLSRIESQKELSKAMNSRFLVDHDYHAPLYADSKRQAEAFKKMVGASDAEAQVEVLFEQEQAVGNLDAKTLILSNEPITFNDANKSVLRRIIPFNFTREFTIEDSDNTLSGKLISDEEFPKVFNYMQECYDELRASYNESKKKDKRATLLPRPSASTDPMSKMIQDQEKIRIEERIEDKEFPLRDLVEACIIMTGKKEDFVTGLQIRNLLSKKVPYIKSPRIAVLRFNKTLRSLTNGELGNQSTMRINGIKTRGLHGIKIDLFRQASNDKTPCKTNVIPINKNK